jgi:ABC-type nitrate/sulfonate/bicarbonate transport system permease component
MKHNGRQQRIALSLAAVSILILAWNLAAIFFHSSFLPTPVSVTRRLIEGFWNDPIITASSGVSAGIGRHLLSTALRSISFVAIGIATASLLLLFATCSSELRRMLTTSARIANVVPPFLALAIAHAMGLRSVFVEAAGGSFYATLSLVSVGIAAIDKIPSQHLFLARAGGASQWWTATRIYARWIEVECLLSIKSVASFTLGITVLIEFLLAPNGVGRVLKFALSFNSAELMLASLLGLVVLGTTIDLALGLFVQRRLRWMLLAGS